MKKTIFYISIIIAIAIIAFSIYTTISFKNSSVYNDLRTRVTGTRLLNHQKSAYFGKWETGDPITLQNPTRNSAQLVNGNTVTPTVMLFTKKLNNLPLHSIVNFWYYSTYFCLLAIVAMFCFKIYKNKTLSPLLIILVALFSVTAGFKMHCFTGQMYIFYTFFVALSLFLFTENKLILAAIVAGIVTTFRLPMALLFLPFFFFQKKQCFHFVILYYNNYMHCM